MTLVVASPEDLASVSDNMLVECWTQLDMNENEILKKCLLFHIVLF